jgi:hypothetical protein
MPWLLLWNFFINPLLARIMNRRGIWPSKVIVFRPPTQLAQEIIFNFHLN